LRVDVDLVPAVPSAATCPSTRRGDGWIVRRAPARPAPSVIAIPNRRRIMNSQHVETLIIGAGQAGLTTGYHLKRRGRAFLIVDGEQRVGDNWRQQWDTLRLYTPAKYDA